MIIFNNPKMRILEGNMDALSSEMSQKLFEINAMIARERMADPSMINHPSFMNLHPGMIDQGY